MADPVAVLLKFAFIAVLYLFLLWVARSALKDLRRGGPSQRVTAAPEVVAGQPLLVAEQGGGLRAGTSFAVNGSTMIGRSPEADIQVDDRFASSRHARVYEQDGAVFVQDMGSTNGTYLNGSRLTEVEQLRADDKIRVGDTQFRYERR
jgi:pSer/pThr/pTyr-binding forkhead associated (FHA) protein